MAQGPGKGVSVAGGAGGGIGQSPGADRRRGAGVAPPVRAHAGDRTALGQDLAHALADEANAALLRHARQRIGHVVGVVGNRKDPAAPLDLERHALRFKELHHRRGRKGVEGAFEKARIGANECQQLPGLGVVGHIAAALSRDAQLFAHPGVGIEYQHASPAARRGDGGHHARGTRAAHSQINPRAFHRRHTGSRSPPGGRRYPRGCPAGGSRWPR